MIWGPDGQEWGTAAALARRFKVSVWTVYKWRSQYGLTTTRIAGRDYSPLTDAAAIELAKRDETRGRPRMEGLAA